MAVDFGNVANDSILEWVFTGASSAGMANNYVILFDTNGDSLNDRFGNLASDAITLSNTSGTVSNSGDISIVSLADSTITDWAITDSSNNLISQYYGIKRDMDTNFAALAGDEFLIADGDLIITNAGGTNVTLSSYTVGKIADWITGSSFPSESRYMALLDAAGNEITGGSYARQLLTGTGSAKFLNTYTFSGMPACTVRYWALFTAVSGGTEIVRTQNASDVTLSAGDKFGTLFSSWSVTAV